MHNSVTYLGSLKISAIIFNSITDLTWSIANYQTSNYLAMSITQLGRGPCGNSFALTVKAIHKICGACGGA